METKYKVGDKVRVRKDLVVGKKYRDGDKEPITWRQGMVELAGATLTIERIRESGNYVLEETVYILSGAMFEPVGVEKILITADGTTVLARQYEGQKVVKSAEAKCSPSDTFDFMIGAKLAFERLTGETAKPEPQALRPVVKDFKDIKTGDLMLILAEPHDQMYGARFKKHSFVTVLDDWDDHSAICYGVRTDGTTTDAWVHFDEALLFDGGTEPQAVPEPQKPKFKKGDIVKVIGNSGPIHHLKLGGYAVISDAGDVTDIVEVDGVHKSGSCPIHQTVNGMDLELIDPAKVNVSKPKYEVGEIVRIKSSDRYYTDTLVEVIEIKSPNSITNCVKVKGVNRNGESITSDIHLERIEKLHPEQPKIGDLVLITEGSRHILPVGSIALCASKSDRSDNYWNLCGHNSEGRVVEQLLRNNQFKIVTVGEEAKA